MCYNDDCPRNRSSGARAWNQYDWSAGPPRDWWWPGEICDGSEDNAPSPSAVDDDEAAAEWNDGQNDLPDDTCDDMASAETLPPDVSQIETQTQAEALRPGVRIQSMPPAASTSVDPPTITKPPTATCMPVETSRMKVEKWLTHIEKKTGVSCRSVPYDVKQIDPARIPVTPPLAEPAMPSQAAPAFHVNTFFSDDGVAHATVAG